MSFLKPYVWLRQFIPGLSYHTCGRVYLGILAPGAAVGRDCFSVRGTPASGTGALMRNVDGCITYYLCLSLDKWVIPFYSLLCFIELYMCSLRDFIVYIIFYFNNLLLVM